MNKDKPTKKPQEQKAATASASTEEYYFVNIRNPLELRRQLLESTKKTIYCLQHYHKILLIRNKKLKEIETLGNSWKELEYLNKKLIEKIPKYNDALLGASKKEKKLIIKEQPAKADPKKPQEKTELDRLEESLLTIENKLKNLK